MARACAPVVDELDECEQMIVYAADCLDGRSATASLGTRKERKYANALLTVLCGRLREELRDSNSHFRDLSMRMTRH